MGNDLNAKKGDGWVFGFTSSYGGPQAHRFVVRGNELYGLGNTNGRELRKYLLDQRGFPTNPDENAKYFANVKPVATASIGPAAMSWVSAFACADDKLILAGESKPGVGTVQIRDLDYKLLQQVQLAAPPVENGVAIAYGRIHVSLLDGSVAALGDAK
jgi:hypothetical protein